MSLLALSLVRLIRPLHVPSLIALAPQTLVTRGHAVNTVHRRIADHPRNTPLATRPARTKGGEVYKSALRPSILARPHTSRSCPQCHRTPGSLLPPPSAALRSCPVPAASVHRHLGILWKTLAPLSPSAHQEPGAAVDPARHPTAPSARDRTSALPSEPALELFARPHRPSIGPIRGPFCLDSLGYSPERSVGRTPPRYSSHPSAGRSTSSRTPETRPTVGARNRLSPFSTEKVVYAAVVFHCSTRFPHLWTTLWITNGLCLQNDHLLVRIRGPTAMLFEAKICRFRTSVPEKPVENTPSRRYNGLVLSARAALPPHGRSTADHGRGTDLLAAVRRTAPTVASPHRLSPRQRRRPATMGSHPALPSTVTRPRLLWSFP